MLRASLDIANANAPRTVLSKKYLSDQIAFDQINDEMPKVETEPVENPIEEPMTVPVATPVEAPTGNAIENILAEHNAIEEKPVHTEEKPHAKARKKKVRAMFDMISFDDI
jgi:hypothetical protein